MTRPKHRPPPCGVAIYDGRDILASASQFRTGGLWHAHDANRVCLGAFPSREQALGFIQAHVNRLAAAPLKQERAADMQRTKIIRQHRKLEREQRASMGGRRRKTATA
jgi:hypothetical protein